MTALYNLGWTYEDGKWYHKSSCRVVEINYGDEGCPTIQVYQKVGQEYHKGWLTLSEFDVFSTFLHDPR